MEIPMNLLDEPRILFQVGRDEVDSKADARHSFYTPPRGTHHSYLTKHCHVYSSEQPFVPLDEKHGFAIEPDSRSYTRQLLPMLSQTRLDPCFADILFPTPYYFSAAEKYALF
jgi:hypothetical protein